MRSSEAIRAVFLGLGTVLLAGTLPASAQSTRAMPPAPVATAPATYADFLLARAKEMLRGKPDAKTIQRAVTYLGEAQAAANAEAVLLFASLLIKGEGVRQNLGQAEGVLLRAARQQSNTEAWVAVAELYLAHPEFGDPKNVAEAFGKALDLGDKRFEVRFGRMLVDGKGLDRDLQRGLAYLTDAMGGSDAARAADAADALGDIYVASKTEADELRAIDAYRRAVAGSVAGSELKLARLLFRRGDRSKDFDETESLLKAALAGGAVGEANELLGDLYSDPAGPGDPRKAVVAYQAAVAAGSGGAALKLARLLVQDSRIPSDPARAEKLLVQISGGNLGRAAYSELAKLYGRGGALANPLKLVGVLQNLVDLGAPWAMTQLGEIYAKGDGVPADPVASELLYQSAIDSGLGKQAYFLLGELHARKGDGRLPGKAQAAFAKAAEMGNIWGSIRQARMIAEGDGSKPDFEKARGLLEAAAAAADNPGPALSTLGDLYAQPGADWFDAAKAADAYGRAASSGFVDAKVKLGRMLAEGTILPADPKRAEGLLAEAVEAGRSEAARYLADLIVATDSSPSGTARAKALYEQAAAGGSAEAGLVLATWPDAGYRETADRARSVNWLRQAASGLGPQRVAREMLSLPPDSLIRAVQQMLTDAGFPLAADGVMGGATRASIVAFCSARSVRGCDAEVITRSTIAALLEVPVSGGSVVRR